jgi:tRNA-dihydrouridine synthase B
MVNTIMGNLSLKSRIFLAPMLEPNDIAFRLLCKKAGCPLTYTGMVSPLSKQKLFFDDKPCLQLFGNSEKGIKSFMKKYDSKVSMWDFNLGCPSKMSEKLCHGVFMHNDLEMIETIFKTMRMSTKKPCSVKLRKSGNSIKIARLAEKCLFDLVCIHPRTQKQGYSGEVDYDFALKLKKAVNIPVIYSGNVGLENCKKILKDFDFCMVGREAIGNPGIFYEMGEGGNKERGKKECGGNKGGGKKLRVGFKDYLKLAKKYKLFFRQIKYQAMNFTKGEKSAKEMRRELIGAKRIKDIEKVFGNT